MENENGNWSPAAANHGSAGDATYYRAAIALEDARERAREARRQTEESTGVDGEIIYGALIGWRNWKVDAEQCLLKSPYKETLWPLGEPMWAGLPEKSPLLGSGIYAYKTKRQAMENKNIYVVGSVWLWGEIVEHERGYRAEFASMRSIDYMTSWPVDEDVCRPFKAWRWKRKLQKRYGL